MTPAHHDDEFGDEADPPMARADLLLALAAVIGSWLAVLALAEAVRAPLGH